MRVPKPLIFANAGALLLNGIILALMAMRALPPLLGLALLLASLAGSIWLSAWTQRVPKKERPQSFYAAPTERMETL